MSSFDFLPRLREVANLVPHKKTFSKHVGYGTAGFRCNADSLPMDSIYFRMGVFAGLRSKNRNGQAIGVMVTASHNPPQDNGLKIVDVEGGMLAESCEPICEKMANTSDEDFEKVVLSIIGSGGEMPVCPSATGLVLIGRDTRSSSERLTRCLIRGVQAVGAAYEDYGLVHTPLVHHIVRMFNGADRYVWASIGGFYDMLEDGLRTLLEGKKIGTCLVDCAGGVGGIVMPPLMERLTDIMTMNMINKPSGNTKTLNVDCGAEFVQKSQLPPKNFTGYADNLTNKCCSFDGDADRLIYHFYDTSNKWHLLDGDKISCLLASYVQSQLSTANLSQPVSVSVAQTAYANGASSRYIRETLGLEVALAKTGVKHIDKRAHEYDLSVFFEANGHGTVHFSNHITTLLRKPAEGAAAVARRRLLAFRQVCNQATGDAIAMMLAVEASMVLLGWGVQEWGALYTDLPSRQGKVLVTDRTKAVCNDDETRLVQPEKLQADIDALVKQHKSGRAFVRPSGTEDAVRVYAEAEDQASANKLAFDVATATWKCLGGTQPTKKQYNLA